MPSWLDMLAGPTRGAGVQDMQRRPQQMDMSSGLSREEEIERKRQEALASYEGNEEARMRQMQALQALIGGRTEQGQPLNPLMQPPREYSPMGTQFSSGWNPDRQYNAPLSENERNAAMLGSIPGMTTAGATLDYMAQPGMLKRNYGQSLDEASQYAEEAKRKKREGVKAPARNQGWATQKRLGE